ncbi:hypothetical protein HED49_09040 [Ochrobactrum daejeonense]|nr:hypothetical protein [Brucella daejeonensis]
MNTAWATEIPLSIASPENPMNELINKTAGMLQIRAPTQKPPNATMIF